MLRLRRIAIGGALFLLLLLVVGCRPAAESAGSHIALSAAHELIFLDSTRAATAICRDRTDDYFERVRVRDMTLQLGMPDEPIVDTVALRQRYQRALAASVRDFRDGERALLATQLQEIYPVVAARFPGLWPPRIELIKVTGEHFGSSAFYTREQGIYFPAAQLEFPPAPRVLRQVLLHEVFHLISRRFRERQAALYQTIGFVAPEFPLLLPDSLADNRLLNPDGIPEDWLIRIDSRWALPVIYRAEHVAARTDFIAALEQTYVSFTLRAGAFLPVGEEVDLTRTPAFLRQTGGNTDYTIHPDEILAEHFTLLFLELTGLPAPESPAGKQALDRLAAQLRAISGKS